MSKFTKCFTLFILACVTLCVAGLRCWTCENAISPDDCVSSGYSKQCRFLEKSCQTEVRLSEGMSLRIKTGCKESHACINNKIQNPRQAWKPVQCNGDIWNSVCRCCCQSNHCNKKNLLCESTERDAPEKLIELEKDLPKQEKTFKPDKPTCGKLPADPVNGMKSCKGSGKLGTDCTFSCDKGYTLIGSPFTTCFGTHGKPSWTYETPACVKPAICPDLGYLKHGDISCSDDDNRVGTTCYFWCIDEGYQLMPSNRTQIECIENGNKAKWSKRKPCCSSQCPPMAKKDVVIVMDSSSSISKSEWMRMKQFVADVIGQFNVSHDGVQFAVYRFFRDVDLKHQVHFGDFTNDVEGLKQAVLNLPKSRGGTYIGRALRHARDNVLNNGNRRDVKDLIWVLTDGRSDDPTEEVAQELRDAGVEIIALGISRRGKEVFRDELLRIAGHEDRVLDVKNGMRSLTKDLVDKIVGKFCESSCQE